MAQAKLELLLELKNRLKGGLSAAKNSVLTSMKDLKGKLNDFTTTNLKAFSSITNEIPVVGRAISLLANPYALAAAAALSFGAATVKATSMALDWQSGLAKVNVTAGLNQKALDGLSKKLLMIGSRNSMPLEQVPDAFNTIISAVGDANVALKILEPTLKASKAGFTDIKTVAEAATGVMASSGADINVVYDTLFATLKDGKAEFAAIAQYLPKIIPGARLAGISLGETAGAFAFLTSQVGQTSEQSATGLMNAFKALSDPRFITGFKKIGVDVFDAQGKFRGLVPIVEDVNASMVGLTDEQRAYKFDLIGLDMEARGAFSGMMQNVLSLKEIIDNTTNSQGQLAEAVKNSKTATEGWAMGWNKVKLVAIEFGELFLPIIDRIGSHFDFFMENFVRGMIILKSSLSGLWEATKASIKLDNPITAFGKGFKDTFDQYKTEINDKLAAQLPSKFGSESSDQVFNSGSMSNMTSAPSASVSTMTSAPTAHQSKSVNIYIDSLHKGDNNIKHDAQGISLREFEQKMNELFLQMIRNVEASY